MKTTCFKDWMLMREAGSMDTTGAYTPISGNQLANSQSFSLHQPQPQQMPNPNVPWQIANFKNWYNDGRGSWAEVMQAAQMDPQVKAFLGQMAQSLVKDGMHYPQKPGKPGMGSGWDDDEFDIEAPTKMGDLADQLENMVKKVIPQHGRHRAPAPAANPPKGARPAPASMLGQSSMTAAHPQNGMGATHNMASQLSMMQSRSQNPETTQLLDVVRTLVLRIDDIERRLGGVTSAA